MITNQYLEYMKKELNKQLVTIEDISVFCEKFIIQQFDERMLELKSFSAQREIVNNTFIESKIIITADHYLHCFDNYTIQEHKKTYSKPSVSIKLSYPIITIMQDLILKVSNKKNLF